MLMRRQRAHSSVPSDYSYHLLPYPDNRYHLHASAWNVGPVSSGFKMNSRPTCALMSLADVVNIACMRPRAQPLLSLGKEEVGRRRYGGVDLRVMALSCSRIILVHLSGIIGCECRDA